MESSLLIHIVGTQNLAPVELTSELDDNSLHNLHINKQQGINTPQWETQAMNFFDYSCNNYNYK